MACSLIAYVSMFGTGKVHSCVGREVVPLGNVTVIGLYCWEGGHVGLGLCLR